MLRSKPGARRKAPEKPKPEYKDTRQFLADMAYRENMQQQGMKQVRVWLPEEMVDWHAALIRRLRDWRKTGQKFDMPDTPEFLHRPPRGR